MAKTNQTADTPARSIDSLRIGELVHVLVQPGTVLINNETGATFEPGVATPVTVTATLLRRLQDGDLALA